MRYFIPNPSGDFRLIPDPNDAARSLLIVENATPSDLATIRAFLEGPAREKGWTTTTLGDEVRAIQLTLLAPVRETGPLLAVNAAQAHAGAFTAVRSENGKISIDVEPSRAVAAAESREKKDGKPEAAVTTKRPTLCCPYPVTGPADVRASEVLQEFCTPKQWRDWTNYGWLIAHGQMSGHAYRIAHRHSDEAKAQGKIVWDLDDDRVIHCWDWTVPPAEEVLGVKLILEGREPWIRNRSAALGAHRDTFANPLGSDGLDGTDNAAMVQMAGAPLMAYPWLYAMWARGDWSPGTGIMGPNPLA